MTNEIDSIIGFIQMINQLDSIVGFIHMINQIDSIIGLALGHNFDTIRVETRDQTVLYKYAAFKTSYYKLMH